MVGKDFLVEASISLKTGVPQNQIYVCISLLNRMRTHYRPPFQVPKTKVVCLVYTLFLRAPFSLQLFHIGFIHSLQVGQYLHFRYLGRSLKLQIF